MRSRRLTLAIHGARADHPALREAVQVARDQGHEIHPRVTWEHGDATRFAREAVTAGHDAVVAVGGDGTVNEALNGLTGRTALGIIPLGTANDFAAQVGIPDEAGPALDVILSHNPVRIDTAEVSGRRFLNVSAGGIGAEATAETPAGAKALLGPLAYALSGLRKFVALEHQRVTVETPSFERAFDLLLFAVGNARRTGSGIALTPHARANDGLLDVVLVEQMPHGEFARLALKLRAGEHVGEEGVHYLRVPWVVLRADAEMSVNVDGEPVNAARLEYRARPLDLLMHLPPAADDAPALSTTAREDDVPPSVPRDEAPPNADGPVLPRENGPARHGSPLDAQRQ